MKDANGLQYFLTDHLGSIVAVTDSSGTLTSQQRYLPFGGVRADLPIAYRISQTDFGYTGQRDLGGDLGLMDYRARFYDPYLSRFLQPDSLIPSAGNPQAFNRYSYVGNRPINFNDPTGHKWDDCGERTGYACKIHMKQVGIIKAQWEKEKEASSSNSGVNGCAVVTLVCVTGGSNGLITLGSGFAGGTTSTGSGIIATASVTSNANDDCQTVTCRAIQGDISALIELLIPTHGGARIQGELAAGFGYFGMSGSIGVNLVYNRIDDRLALSVDWAIEPGIGILAGGSVTAGPLIGWESTDVNDATSGYSGILSGTVAGGPAVSVSLVAPFHVDPHYGQVPFTIFLGGGAGAGYAGAGGGLSGTFIQIDLTDWLP